jgi:hypothetical protein
LIGGYGSKVGRISDSVIGHFVRAKKIRRITLAR